MRKCTIDLDVSEQTLIADQIYCDWELEKEGVKYYWITMCGNTFFLPSDSPKEDEYNFCPGCGRHIRWS